MPFRLRQVQNQSQKLILSPQMQQAIHMLQIPLMELAQLAQQEMVDDTKKIREYRERFLKGLSHIKNVKVNGDVLNAVPHILNLRFEGMLADAILSQLPNIATSTASACQGKGTQGSYVLRAMGLSDEDAKSSMRFSFGRFTTMQEVDEAVRTISQLFI